MPVGSGGQAYALVDEPRETHRVARGGVYIFPDSHEIDDRYLMKALPVIHAQLAKAAVRVAGVPSWVLGRQWGLARCPDS